MEAKRDVKGLIKVLDYQKDASVREAAAGALVKIGTPAVELLIAALKDSNSPMRIEAAGVLGQISDALSGCQFVARTYFWGKMGQKCSVP